MEQLLVNGILYRHHEGKGRLNVQVVVLKVATCRSQILKHLHEGALGWYKIPDSIARDVLQTLVDDAVELRNTCPTWAERKNHSHMRHQSVTT